MASNVLGELMSITDARFEVLQSAPMDKWIALSGDESKVVAVGSTYSEAVANSERAGESDPVIIKTPKVWAPLSV
jgi:hypothetical protein